MRFRCLNHSGGEVISVSYPSERMSHADKISSMSRCENDNQWYWWKIMKLMIMFYSLFDVEVFKTFVSFWSMIRRLWKWIDCQDRLGMNLSIRNVLVQLWNETRRGETERNVMQTETLHVLCVQQRNAPLSRDRPARADSWCGKIYICCPFWCQMPKMII